MKTGDEGLSAVGARGTGDGIGLAIENGSGNGDIAQIVTTVIAIIAVIDTGRDRGLSRAIGNIEDGGRVLVQGAGIGDGTMMSTSTGDTDTKIAVTAHTHERETQTIAGVELVS